MSMAFKRNTILSNNILQRCITKKYQEEIREKKVYSSESVSVLADQEVSLDTSVVNLQTQIRKIWN